MVNWLVIGVVILAIFVVSKLIHFRQWKHKLFAVVLILLAFFIYTTFSGVVNSSNINLKNPAGMFHAVKVYFTWFGQAFGNLREITGSAVKMDWMPRNITISP